jgi:hypothetical protein
MADDGPGKSNQAEGISRREFVTTVGAGSVAAAALATSGVSANAALPIYRIHPAIGVARVGNADPSTFFIGPEVPGQGPSGDAPGTSVPPYKINGLVKPQAARFRIWEYGYVNGVLTPLREVNLSTAGVTNITWRVHVANRKSAFYEENGPAGEVLPAGPLRNLTVGDRSSLQSDFGPRFISGASANPVDIRPSGSPGEFVVKGPDGVTPLINYLGQLRSDSQGRLIFIGGDGSSFSNINPPQPLTHWSNNNNWFDGIADGPVSATVTVGGIDVPMDAGGNAWILTAPPDFAPRIASAVSLYDVLYDMGVRHLPVPANSALYQAGGALYRLAQLNATFNASPFDFSSFQPDFQTEIWPSLLIAVNYVYVTGLVNFKHSSMLDPSLGDPSPTAAKTRGGVFTFLRPPEGFVGTGPQSMPKLYGDDWYQGGSLFGSTFGQNGPGNGGGGGQSFPTPAHVPAFVRYQTLTHTQYALLAQWSNGNFIPAPGITPPAASPHDLDRAALENCIGGPFYPGIECGWQVRNANLFIEPFRLKYDPADPAKCAKSQYLDPTGEPENTPITAGHFSRQMAVPWQADFNDCVRALNLGWWPSQRPDDVFLHATDPLNQRVPWARANGKWPSGSFSSSHEDMQANWWKFGFVVQTFGGYIETERAAQIP